MTSILAKQIEKRNVPSATLLYGENLDNILNHIASISHLIMKNTIELSNEPTEDISEPSEDVIIVNPLKSIKIDLIKTLQHRIKYGPSNNTYLMIIIHNIQRLTNSATNALLKSIEEPPNQTLFFLTTKNKLNVPQTIKSRTQHIHIPEPTNEKTAQFNNEVLSINEQLPYITPLDFLEKSPFERTIYIQSLPNETPMLTRLLSLWQQSLFDNLSKLKKREHIFLQKIIEIISNIKYNFNLKLQLLTATFILESEEEDLQ